MKLKTESVLRQLYNVVKKHHECFPASKWTKISGEGSDEVIFERGFKDLKLVRGANYDIETVLDLPEYQYGVKLDGESLLVRISSLYPVSLWCDDELVFHEDGVPVAAGPALINWVEKLDVENPPRLRCQIRVPDQEPFVGVYLHCYTPTMLERYEILDNAWAQLAWSNAIAESQDELTTVAKATVEAEKLCFTDVSSQIVLICAKISDILASFDNKAKTMNVHLIGHCHIDLCWLWRYPDTVEVIRRDMRSILSLMNDFPELTFSFSQPAAYEIMQREEPELFEQVKAHIKSGRWEATTMQWVESDVNMPSGEAQVRQILEGVNYTREFLGVSPTVFHAPDTFGHAGNLPQLAVSAGAKYYYHHRSNPNDEEYDPAYIWEGDDGSRILAMSTISYNGEISAGRVVSAAIRARNCGLNSCMFFHGIGDHCGGPSRQNLQALRRIKKVSGLPNMFCSRIDAYGDEIINSGVELPVHKGESVTVFEGCYTTHSDTKLYNRKSENMLIDSETLAVMANVDHNENISNAWKKTLFNQFHDILCGSSISDVYIDQAEDFARISEVAQKSLDKSCEIIWGQADDDCIAVTNTLGFKRRELVNVAALKGRKDIKIVSPDGKIVNGQPANDGFYFLAEVPAFSTEKYKIKTSKKIETSSDFSVESAYKPSEYSYENINFLPDEKPYYQVETPFFSVYIRRDNGVIVSLFDKRENRQLVGHGFHSSANNPGCCRPDLGINVFQITHEKPHGMTSWQIEDLDTTLSLISGAETEILEQGTAKIVIRVKHKDNGYKISENIIFYRDLPRIDFKADINWQQSGSPKTGVPGLKVSCNISMNKPAAWFEMLYTVVQRPCDGREAPALRWAGVDGDDYGFAILNDCKYGYDILGSRVRMTILRNAYDPDPQSDTGKHQCAWSFVPYSGSWNENMIGDLAMAFNRPLYAGLVSGESNYPVSQFQGLSTDASSSIRIKNMKPALDKQGVILRLAECSGITSKTKIYGIPNGFSLTACNIMEDIQETLKDNMIQLSPWQIMTIRITK